MTSKDGQTLNYNVHVYPKNETIRGAVELKKIDGKSGAGLAGVTFNLYKANNELVREDLTTDANGYIRIQGLEYGDYYFKEVATKPGYVLQSGKFEFKIEKSGTVNPDGTHTGVLVKVEAKNYVEPEIQKSINNGETSLPINRETEFTYNLKVKLPADIKDYKEFVITDVLDPKLAYANEWTVYGVAAGVLNFTSTGQTLKWAVADFGALAGKDEITIHFKAKINADAEADKPIENKANVGYENKSGTSGVKESNPVTVTPTEGSVSIQKVDTEGKVLAGAVFELRKLDGTVVGTKTTDADGKLSFTGLDYGDYLLVETKAPDGYRKLTSPIEVKVDAQHKHETYEVVNSKSGWELPKTGGMGTILFSVAGSGLMAAAIFLVARRRKEHA